MLGALHCAALAITLFSSGIAFSAPIEFGLFGDTPYTRWERENLGKLIDRMNVAPLAFVIHVGDIKNRRTRCSNEHYQQVQREFQRSKNPVVYLPGDNEWTDCHGGVNRDFEPVERLAKLREIFMSGETALGQQYLVLERQSAVPRFSNFRENVRWEIGGIQFVAVHVVASNNGYFGTSIDGSERTGPTAEFAARSEAVAHWLRDTFARARDRKLPAILIATHANAFERKVTEGPGYDFFIEMLRHEAENFPGEVVLVHGDTHFQRVDQPMTASSGKVLRNLTRVETYGSPAFGWIRVEADAARSPVFRFSLQPFSDRNDLQGGVVDGNE